MTVTELYLCSMSIRFFQRKNRIREMSEVYRHEILVVMFELLISIFQHKCTVVKSAFWNFYYSVNKNC